MTDPITATAEDHVKAIWAALEWGGAPMTVTGLAARFGTTPAAASATVKRLVGQGLLVHEPYGPILLTAAGERQAVMMVRRHRLIETFLVEHLGYSWGEVHAEAENLEHAVSDMLVDRIDEILGNPEVDPHGDPIPTRDGTVTYPEGAERLAIALVGRHRIVRISDNSAELLEWCESRGLHTGVVVEVAKRQGSDTLVGVAGSLLRLAEEVAEAIIVGPA